MKTDIASLAENNGLTFNSSNKVLATALRIASEKEHSPIVILVSDDDVCPVAGQYKDDLEKDMFVEGIQRIAAAMKAHTSVFIHEAWLTVLPKGKGIPTDEEITRMRASGALRQEALLVSIEQRGKKPVVGAAMIGVEGGSGPRKIGPFEVLPGNGMTGRMLDMLGDLKSGETV